MNYPTSLIVILSLLFVKCNAETLCEKCTKPLLNLVEEVGQDIDYARATIDSNKLADKLMTELDELIYTFDQHSFAYEESQIMVSVASANIMRLMRRNESIISASTLEKFIADLELETYEIDGQLVPDMTYELALLHGLISQAHILELETKQITTIVDFTEQHKVYANAEPPVEDRDSTTSYFEESSVALCTQRALSLKFKSILKNFTDVHPTRGGENDILKGYSEDIPSVKIVRELYDDLTSSVNELNTSSINSMTQAVDLQLRKSLYNLRDKVIASKTELLALKKSIGISDRQSTDPPVAGGHDSILQALQAILR